MEAENIKLKKKLEQHRATIIDERKIKDELVNKLNLIKDLVNTPLSMNRSSRAAKIKFLGSSPVKPKTNSTPTNIINQIKKILNNEE